MFHLLPQKETKLLEREYHLRLFFICLVFILASLVVGSVFLLPSYLLSEVKLADISAKNQEIHASIVAKKDPTLSSFLASLKENLTALTPVTETPPFSSVIRKVADVKKSGIHLRKFDQDGGTLLVGGIADNRQVLLDFSHALEAIPDFSKVDLPISDFAKDKNIDFSITISLKKP